jgi:RNA polymerase sigma-70 factor (ECF subfamily)
LGDRLGLTEEEVADAYRRYGHLVRLRCQRILRRDAAVEDALQEVYLRLWRYGESFRQAESRLGWLYRVAERCAYDQLAKRRGAERSTAAAASGDEASERDARALEDAQVVLQFLGELDDRLRQVAVHHYLDEMTQEQIASATGWSRQTIVKKLALLADEARRLRARLEGG